MVGNLTSILLIMVLLLSGTGYVFYKKYQRLEIQLSDAKENIKVLEVNIKNKDKRIESLLADRVKAQNATDEIERTFSLAQNELAKRVEALKKELSKDEICNSRPVPYPSGRVPKY